MPAAPRPLERGASLFFLDSRCLFVAPAGLVFFDDKRI